MAKPITARERSKILKDIQDGTLSRAAIARKHKRSPGTVSNVARDAGILDDSFTRANTVKATRARAADMADERTRLQERWLAKAHEGLDRTEEPCVVYAFGGKENVYEEHTFSRPPAAEYRTFITAAAVATDKHLAVSKFDAGDQGADDAKSMLLGVAQGLRALYDVSGMGADRPSESDAPDVESN